MSFEIKQINATGMNNPVRKSGNNIAYILSVEDPTIKAKVRYFVSIKILTWLASAVDFVGSELETKEDINTIKTFEDAENYVNSNDKVNLIIPIHRVINIKNATYNK